MPTIKSYRQSAIRLVDIIEQAFNETVFPLPDGSPQNIMLAEARRMAALAFDERDWICKWIEEDDGVWHGSCGIDWNLEAGDPLENGMNYCPRCGNRLAQRRGKNGEA